MENGGAGGNKAKKWKYLDDTLKNRLKKNSLTHILHFVITFPLIFILTPLILKYVGKEVYGIWVLTGTILIFLELIGGAQASTAMSVIVPRYDPKKQHKDINEVVNTLCVFYLFSAFVFLGVYLLAENSLVSMFFKVGAPLIPLTRFVLGFSFLMFLLNFVLLGYAQLLGALNIRYPVNILHIFVSYIRAGLMIAALYKGYGIKGIVVVQMSTLIAETVIITYMAKRIFPPLRFNPFLFRFEALRRILGLSIKLFFTRAAVIANQHADKLILGYFINPIVAAYYQIGAGITKYIANIPELLGFSAVLPAASELKAKGQAEKIHMLYDRVTKYLFFFGIFLASGIIVFGREFTFLWLGPGYGTVYTVMVFLCAGYLYSLAAYPAMNILNGIGHVTEPMLITGGTAALNIGLSIFLVYKYGLNGALISTVISIIAGTTAMFVYFSVVMKHKIRFRETLLKPAAAAAVAVIINVFIEKAGIYDKGWMLFFTKAFLFTGIYFALSVFVFRHFDEKDMSMIRDIKTPGKNREPRRDGFQ